MSTKVTDEMIQRCRKWFVENSTTCHSTDRTREMLEAALDRRAGAKCRREVNDIGLSLARRDNSKSGRREGDSRVPFLQPAPKPEPDIPVSEGMINASVQLVLNHTMIGAPVPSCEDIYRAMELKRREEAAVCAHIWRVTGGWGGGGGRNGEIDTCFKCGENRTRLVERRSCPRRKGDAT